MRKIIMSGLFAVAVVGLAYAGADHDRHADFSNPKAPAAAPGGAARAPAAALAGKDSILPCKENSQMLSPFLPAPNKVPADITATYCVPSYSKVVAGALTPASV